MSDEVEYTRPATITFTMPEQVAAAKRIERYVRLTIAAKTARKHDKWWNALMRRLRRLIRHMPDAKFLTPYAIRQLPRSCQLPITVYLAPSTLEQDKE
jgi:hypothetical protein